MKTIIINVDEAAEDLGALIHRLREYGNRAVLVDVGGPLVEITPVMRSDASGADGTLSSDAPTLDEKPRERSRATQGAPRRYRVDRSA